MGAKINKCYFRWGAGIKGQGNGDTNEGSMTFRVELDDHQRNGVRR